MFLSSSLLSQGLGHAECLRLVGDEGKPLDENPTDPAAGYCKKVHRKDMKRSIATIRIHKNLIHKAQQLDR